MRKDGILNLKKNPLIYFSAQFFPSGILVSHDSLEEKVAYLHNVIKDGISQFVPLTKKRLFKNAWWNNKLQSLKNRKNKEWKRYRSTGDKSLYII